MRKHNGMLENLPTYIDTFDSCHLPEKVSVGWTKCPIDLYIPRPRRCFKCQAFGHGTNSCRAQVSTCQNCGESEHETRCSKQAKCANCLEAHPATSRDGYFYKFEEEVLAIQAKVRISYQMQSAKFQPDMSHLTKHMPELQPVKHLYINESNSCRHLSLKVHYLLHLPPMLILLLLLWLCRWNLLCPGAQVVHVPWLEWQKHWNSSSSRQSKEEDRKKRERYVRVIVNIGNKLHKARKEIISVTEENNQLEESSDAPHHHQIEITEDPALDLRLAMRMVLGEISLLI